MKFLIAPDSFKESMSARQACVAIDKAIKAELPDAETILLPMADGGEGTLPVLVSALDGNVEAIEVSGPLAYAKETETSEQPMVNAQIGILSDDTAVIEMAEAAGLHLVPTEKRNPELTTTFGVGQMILHALDLGIRHFLIALGGSATNDGGLGMLTALGAKAQDKSGTALAPTGGNLKSVVRLDVSALDPRLADCQFMLACDVDNPLTGATGASAIFGPQKGATPEQVTALDQGLENWAEILNETYGRQIKDIPGSGAAGGLSAAFLAAFDTSLKPGIEQVLDIVEFDQKCADVDWVITGEGSLDGQSLAGKTPVGVARRAKQFEIPVVAFAGRLGDGYEAVYEEGIDLALSITPEGMPLEQALAEAENNICNSTRVLIQLLFSSETTQVE
ncbi:glycerate kinase [Oceanospirillum sanctuarii]|uniref:glycerate kinase n=1 Tax=Oceanospirillum sanctuarii TaxID=1434821 RepID=UPI000A3BC890|nr:glycerate kinase [Oceanospirillum sanctuarii]